jgi:hypothetical protein
MSYLAVQGDIEMNAGIVVPTQRRLLALVIAAALALTAFAAPMAVEQIVGVQLTQSASACHGGAGGGC